MSTAITSVWLKTEVLKDIFCWTGHTLQNTYGRKSS